MKSEQTAAPLQTSTQSTQQNAASQSAKETTAPPVGNQPAASPSADPQTTAQSTATQAASLVAAAQEESQAQAAAAARPSVVDQAVTDKKTADAAKQFESLVVAEMLKSARESSDGSFFGNGESSSGVTPIEFAEQALAQTIGENGGLGLSKLLLEGLAKQAAALNVPTPARAD
jgi:hypothetical protein